MSMDYCYLCLANFAEEDGGDAVQVPGFKPNERMAHRLCQKLQDALTDQSNAAISKKLDQVLEKLDALLSIGFGEITRRGKG